MPRGDKTGPEGLGSMTGRGLGPCAGYETAPPARTVRRGRGRRFWGRGRGPGRRRFAEGVDDIVVGVENQNDATSQMRLSDLINRIREMIETYGDIEVSEYSIIADDIPDSAGTGNFTRNLDSALETPQGGRGPGFSGPGRGMGPGQYGPGMGWRGESCPDLR